MPGAPSSQDDRIDLRDYIDNLFHGPTAHLADRMTVCADSCDGMSCADLTDPGVIKQLLDAYAAARYPGDDTRAAASFWSQWYFGFLIPPLLLLSMAAEAEVPARLSSLRLVLDAQGQPERFILSAPFVKACDTKENVFDCLSPLIDGHLSPLVFSLAARSGVSAKVFWMNAAVVIDYTYDMFMEAEGPNLKLVTTEPKRPDGSRNPLYGPYRPSSSEATRTRRVCCLRYGLCGVDRCPDCSLKPAIGQEPRRVIMGAGKFT